MYQNISSLIASIFFRFFVHYDSFLLTSFSLHLYFIVDCFCYSDLKMVLYSAHDTTLMAVLFALGVYDYKWPKYAADVKIELYKDRVCA